MGFFGIFHREAVQEDKMMDEVLDLSNGAKEVIKLDIELRALLTETRNNLKVTREKISPDIMEGLRNIQNHVERKDLTIAKFHLKTVLESLKLAIEETRKADRLSKVT